MWSIKSEHFKLLVPIKLQHKFKQSEVTTAQMKDSNLWSTVLIMYLQVYQNNQRSTQTGKKTTHVLSHFCAQRLLFCTIRDIIYIKYDVKASVVPVASRISPFFLHFLCV